MENLKLLQASISYDTIYLITQETRIKFLLNKIQNNLNLITISPRLELVIIVGTPISNYGMIIPHQKLHNWEIAEYLTIGKNGQTITTVLNNTTSPVTIGFSEPFNIKNFIGEAIKEFNVNNFNDTSKQNINISKLIRTEHLNSEGKDKTTSLGKEFSDILCQENTSPTFTGRTKDHTKWMMTP